MIFPMFKIIRKASVAVQRRIVARETVTLDLETIE